MNKRSIFIAVVLAAVVLAGVFVARTVRHGSHADHAAFGETKELYQCSMHPHIVSEKPGDCAICGMRLTKVDETEAETLVESARTREKGSKTPIFYRHPMNPSVTSPVPAKDEMGMDYIPVYEEEGVEGSSVPGHAAFTLSTRRQQLIGVETAPVEKKDLSLVIRTVGKIAYDPELYNAVAEYREALVAKRQIKDSPLPEAHERAEALIKSAALKLRLMGISEKGLREMMEESPDPVNLLLPGKTAWVYGQIYEYEVDLVKPGQPISVTAPSLPGRTYRGKVSAIDPVLNAATRSVRVRAEIDTPDARLRPESFVHLRIDIPLGRRLAVPENSVLQTGEHQIVFVKQGEGHFEPRSILIGREAEGHYEVLSGLAEGEEVVTAANFLIDSESRFKSALSAFSEKGKGAQPAAPGHAH